jgi:hypothetical protein
MPKWNPDSTSLYWVGWRFLFNLFAIFLCSKPEGVECVALVLVVQVCRDTKSATECKEQFGIFGNE